MKKPWWRRRVLLGGLTGVLAVGLGAIGLSMPSSQAVDASLVVVTLPGLVPPPADMDRDLWGSSERYAQPLRHLAAFFTARVIYGRPRSVR